MEGKNIKVYMRRQTVLLICLAVFLILFIVFGIYFFIFRDNESINNDISAVSGISSADVVPADVQDSSSPDYNSICFEESEITIEIGEKYTPELKNAESPDDVFNWESSNTAVAVVSDNGEITGIGEGSCDITVCVRNTDTMLTLKVTVVPAGGSSEHEIIEENGLTYIDGILIANKSYSMPADYDPGASEEALAAFDRMQADAAAEGLDIYISSGYRSYYDQERIYNSYVAEDGQEAADTYSSRPGFSDHQTGLAFDLNSIDDSFGYTAESDWVAANAHKYGFIIRYPKGKEDITGYQYEPWHIRYIGVEKATEVYESGLCLEEFLGIDSVYKD
ncbi:D-alanyl-D-alanine carboxypeptidase family protein [Porcipelethomonas sp.]|uniref:D-alanyl-D-alanine carboxypeptidase family protein n=1 Tax=Porcipelethomonas sp. TaxID=2981675 RepID=UPI003EF732AD